jgi:hypothetical protein
MLKYIADGILGFWQMYVGIHQNRAWMVSLIGSGYGRVLVLPLAGTHDLETCLQKAVTQAAAPRKQIQNGEGILVYGNERVLLTLNRSRISRKWLADDRFGNGCHRLAPLVSLNPPSGRAQVDH